jgi:hypothetical protein
MRAQRARKGAEGTRPLRRISPARMPSSKESDPAPVRETALRFGLAARRSTPVKTDAEIEYMVAVTRVVVDGFDAIKKIRCDDGYIAEQAADQHWLSQITASR